MRRWPPTAVWATALGVGLFQVVGSFGAAANQPDRKSIDAVALLLVLIGPAALLVRDRWPLLVAGVAAAAADVYIGLGYPYGPIFVSVIVALFSSLQTGRRRSTWLVAAAGYGGYVLMTLVDPRADPGPGAVHLALVAGWLAVVLAVAEVVRVRRDQVADRVRAQDEEEQRRAGEQRLALAHELHDVLAHNISLINVQASVALHLIDERPEQAAPALANIKEASRDALHELRTALDLVRLGDEAPRSPAPRLSDLDALVAGVRASGLGVRLEVDVPPEPLPAAVELAAYRIVQEALTNVTRHARAHSVEVAVHLAGSDGALTVEVADDGVGIGGPAQSGNGIVGMRERAAALGGTVDAGPGPGGGFRIVAVLPGCPVVITVVIADDQALVRAGFRALLDAQDDITVTGEAADGDAACALALDLRPDVVLMDIRMPGVDGLVATRRIASDERLAGVKVVILTTFDLDEYVFEAIRSGANGFLVKDTEPAELLRAVRAVVAGDALLSPGVTRRLIEEFATRAKDPAAVPDLDRLTDREREVVTLVAGGLTNEEIAQRLVMSGATAKTHVSRAMIKLGARDRAQLVVFAYEAGLVRPGWSE